MVDNFFWDLKVLSMYTYIISNFPQDGPKSYHGFAFRADPDWVPSKRTRATNDDTGDVIITESVSEMGRKFFGNKDNYSSDKISRMIRTGEKYRSYRFEDISVGYINCPRNYDTDPVPIIGTHLTTGEIILCLSLKDAAKYIIITQGLNDTYVKTISSKIQGCAQRYMGRNNEMYNYRWTYPE